MIFLTPEIGIPPRYLTRHIGIFGATGTGKTTTAAAIAERLPCTILILDVKGDLESMGKLYRPWQAQLRIKDLGADLIARALDLSAAQAGALQVAMAWAEDSNWIVDNLADLRMLLGNTVIKARDLSATYGLVSPVSVAAVQRGLLRLERTVPWAFGSAVVDWRNVTGRAVLSCSAIAGVPGLYGATVAHILDSLYRGLGELGDVPAPGLMVMIDEAHLVFDGATPSIVRRIEQITRLIRSKGVGLIYVTQSPADLPDVIAGQLTTRIQHGLRAATARQQKGLRAAAETMPGNVTMQDILRLGTGQAIVSVPDYRGVPQPGRAVMVTRGDVPLVPVEAELPPPVARTVIWEKEEEEPAAVGRSPWYLWPLIIVVIVYGSLLFV
ncbi:MAG: DUF853 family protein [Pseudorhodobacter sp.]|nr:DUF853 family protein [Pseudorhodobacter sp.]